jgi:hypothetical protein
VAVWRAWVPPAALDQGRNEGPGFGTGPSGAGFGVYGAMERKTGLSQSGINLFGAAAGEAKLVARHEIDRKLLAPPIGAAWLRTDRIEQGALAPD